MKIFLLLMLTISVHGYHHDLFRTKLHAVGKHMGFRQEIDDTQKTSFQKTFQKVLQPTLSSILVSSFLFFSISPVQADETIKAFLPVQLSPASEILKSTIRPTDASKPQTPNYLKIFFESTQQKLGEQDGAVKQMSTLDYETLKKSVFSYPENMNFLGGVFALFLFGANQQSKKDSRATLEERKEEIQKLTNQNTETLKAVEEEKLAFSQLQEESKSLLEKVTTLSQELVEKSREVTELSNTMEELERSLTSTTSQIMIATLQSDLRDSRTKSDELAFEIKTLKSQQEKVSTTTQSRDLEMKLLGSLKKLVSKLDLLPEGIANMMLASTAPGVVDDIIAKKGEPSVTAKENDELKMKLEASDQKVESSVKSLKESDEKLESSVKSLKASDEKLESTITSLKTSDEANSKLVADIESLKKELSSTEVLSPQMKMKLEESDKTNSKLVAELESSIKSLKASDEKLESSFKSLKASDEASSKLVADNEYLKKELSLRDALSPEIKMKLEESNASVAALTEKVAKISSENAKLLEENTKLTNDLVAARTAAQQAPAPAASPTPAPAPVAAAAVLKTEKEKVEKSSGTSSTQVKKLQEELSDTESKLSSAKAMAKELNAMLMAKDKQLDAKETKLSVQLKQVQATNNALEKELGELKLVNGQQANKLSIQNFANAVAAEAAMKQKEIETNAVEKQAERKKNNSPKAAKKSAAAGDDSEDVDIKPLDELAEMKAYQLRAMSKKELMSTLESFDQTASPEGEPLQNMKKEQLVELLLTTVSALSGA